MNSMSLTLTFMLADKSITFFNATQNLSRFKTPPDHPNILRFCLKWKCNNCFVIFYHHIFSSSFHWFAVPTLLKIEQFWLCASRLWPLHSYTDEDCGINYNMKAVYVLNRIGWFHFSRMNDDSHLCIFCAWNRNMSFHKRWLYILFYLLSLF